MTKPANVIALANAINMYVAEDLAETVRDTMTTVAGVLEDALEDADTEDQRRSLIVRLAAVNAFINALWAR